MNNRSICKVWCFLSSEKLPFGSFPIGFLVRSFQQMCFVLNFDKISRLEGKTGLRFPRPRVNDSHFVPFNLDKMSGSRVIYESQLRNLGWPLRARFVRDKKLNRFLRTNGFVQRVIDRTGAKQGGRNFPLLFRWKSRRNEYSSERPPNCSPTCTPQFATRPTMNKSAVCPRIYFPLLQLAKLHPTFPPLPSIILNLTSRSKMSFLIGMIQTESRHCFLTNEKIDYLIRGN